jgi:hypothetical protein
LLQFDAVSESGSSFTEVIKNFIQGHFSLISNCTLQEKEFEAWRRDLSNRLQVLCPEMSPVADIYCTSTVRCAEYQPVAYAHCPQR